MNEHWYFIAAGYGITWATLGWYLLRLGRREGRTAASSGRGGSA